MKKDVPILQVNNLKTYFNTPRGVLKAVDDVSFYLNRGETLGIVGESGCGKSVTCNSVMRLVQTPPGEYAGGEILFDGQDVLKMPKKKLLELRGSRIAMIFQEPMAALNPVYTIGDQMREALRLHMTISKREADERVLELLKLVRIPNAEKIMRSHPFTLSGGMRQRVVIAMAMACEPDILIADEPTTALDVTIQAQILNLMKKLKEERNTSILFITHDLAVISECADRVMVMYAGKVCESAPTKELIRNACHPYTVGLIGSKPNPKEMGSRLRTIPGNVPSLLKKPSGCPFHPRCSECTGRCKEEFPPVTEIAPGHTVACWKYVKQEDGSHE
ncbi:MAG: ABC transporter ATP-binding protein [Oscillospiraceae bacterium]|nr:ABC transporter ATP-binding protein [Oscillospiraceae bacterium]